MFNFSEGRAIGAAAAVSASGKIPLYASNFVRSSGSGVASKNWITGLLALPAAGLDAAKSLFYSHVNLCRIGLTLDFISLNSLCGEVLTPWFLLLFLL